MECLPNLPLITVSIDIPQGASVWESSCQERRCLPNYSDFQNDPSFLLLRLKVDIERLKSQERHTLDVVENQKIVRQIIEKLIENLRLLHKPIWKSFPKEDRIRDIQRVEAEFRDYLRKRDNPQISFNNRDIDSLYD